ncbi:MAG: GlcG/HbpS family heme-binding protein [Streptosporangiaceae bacterium]
MVTQQPTITLQNAQGVVESARQRAQEIGIPMNIAVVDEGNNLMAFARMEGAWLGSIDISQGKAYTARAFDMPTKDLAPLCQPGQPLYGIQASNQGHLVIFPGGIPLTENGMIVGAVGVSGGTVDQDHDVAAAGASSLM